MNSYLRILDLTWKLHSFSFRPRAYCLADSDEESSSAGSSEEDDAPELAGEKQVTPGAEGWAAYIVFLVNPIPTPPASISRLNTVTYVLVQSHNIHHDRMSECEYIQVMKQTNKTQTFLEQRTAIKPCAAKEKKATLAVWFALLGALFTIQHFCSINCMLLHLTPPDCFAIRLQRETTLGPEHLQRNSPSLSCLVAEPRIEFCLWTWKTVGVQYYTHTDRADPLFPVCSLP